jgi:tetrahydromethanopterin S-methyltransferase subunit C
LASFGDPIEFTPAPSPALAAWRFTVAIAAGAACLIAVPGVFAASGPGGALLPVLAAACAVSRGAGALRAVAAAGRDAPHPSLSLDATGRLVGQAPDGTTLALAADRLVRLPGAVCIEGTTLASPADSPRGSMAVPLLSRCAARVRRRCFVMQDAVDETTWRRLNAWARHGLPAGRANFPGRHRSDSGDREVRA